MQDLGIHISISLVFVMMPAYGDISSSGVSRCHNLTISPCEVNTGYLQNVATVCVSFTWSHYQVTSEVRTN